jgi:hypothetical protein
VSRSSSSWFGRTATGLLTILVLGLVLFFGLTRTEVGRNGLRIQLEQQFNAQFEGTLRIGTLDGNLVNTLFARDVQVRGPNGQVVVQADSLVLRPTWQALLNQTLTLRSVDVHTVHVIAEQTSTGVPLAQAFARTNRTSTGRPPLNLSIPHFRLHDARLTTRHSGPPPPAIANGWVTDLLNTTLELPEADVQVQWSPAGKYADVELRRLQHPASNVMVDALTGRLERTDDGWHLQPVSITTPTSSVEVEGTWSGTQSADAPFTLSLQADPLDLAEWSRLFPRLPNRRSATVEARVRGPLNELVVETLRLQQNASTLSVEGTAVGFPNDIDVEGAVRLQNLTRSIAASWTPNALPVALEGALPLSGEVYGRGQVRAAAQPERLWDWRPASAKGIVEATATSAVGRAQAATDLEWARGAPLVYAGTLSTDQLAVDALFPASSRARTQITGRAAVEGSGTAPQTATAEATLQLAPSVLAGGPLDAMQSRITLSDGAVSGTATLTQAANQELQATWSLDRIFSEAPTLDVALRAQAFDVSAWGGPWQRTRLHGTAEAQAQLSRASIRAGTMQLAVDSSSVTPRHESEEEAAPRAIPPHTLSAELASLRSDAQQQATRLLIAGDVLSGTVEGRGWTAPRMQLLPVWAQSIARTIAYEHAADGAPAGTFPSVLRSAEALPASLLSEQRERPTWEPPPRADGPFTVASTIELHRPDVLRAWVPNAPRTADSLVVHADVYAAPDSMNATVRLTAAHVQWRAADARALDIESSVGADAARTLPERLRLSVQARTQQLEAPGLSLFEPALQLSYARRRGTLSFTTARRNETGPIELEADLRAFDLRNELIIKHIGATAGPYKWRTLQPSTWQLYATRVTATPLRLTSTASLPDRDEVEQSIVIDGGFSPNPNDAINVQLRNVQLFPLSQLAGWSQPLGGEVNGSFEVRGTWTRPIGTGDVTVNELSFDRRLLGNLSATTRYVAGAPDMELGLSLTPTPNVDAPKEATEALVPGGLQHVEDNRLDMEGRVRIAEEAPDWDDGQWIDLALDIGRADLFFFDFIFADVLSDIEGATQGQATITGLWSRPVFDADLTVDGAFSIPRFGLSYTLNGPVQVDREGIHLQNARLTDTDDGAAEIGGSVLFNDYQFFSFDLESQVDNLTIMDVPRANDLPFYGFIRASGPVRLEGPLSSTTLVSEDARTSEDTEIFIPVVEDAGGPSSGFLIYADSTSQMLDWEELTRRANIFADRPAGETSFLDGMEIDLNIEATRGGRLHIVFDALVGDVITTEATGRVQLQRNDGEFLIFGSLDVIGGTYLFTAGEVFVRRFAINEGTLSWDGDPINAELDIDAAFRTRASPAGLPGFSERSTRIPVVIDLAITGRVETPEVALSLSIDRDQRDQRVGSQTFDALLNQEAQMTEFATSVLLTNTFLLTTETLGGGSTGPGESGRLANTGSQLAFNSVSQLVSSQLNRYLSAALPNVDFNVGVQGETTDDLDIIYGVALRLLDERLIIRGEGVYTGNDEFRAQQAGPQGEFAVEVRLSNQVSMEVFYRRAGDALTQGQTLTSTTGVGLFYQTQFSTWSSLWHRVTGRRPAESTEPGTAPPDDEDADMP